jgi:hypothetical protein
MKTFTLLTVAILLGAFVNIFAQPERAINNDPQQSLSPPSIVDNIISIIQNDTIRSFEVWKYTYLTENGVISDPMQLIDDIEYELFIRIPEKFSGYELAYEPFPNCTQIGIQGYHSNPVDKHYAVYTKDSVDYVLCFYVLDWDPSEEEVEVNYTVQVARFWR